MKNDDKLEPLAVWTMGALIAQAFLISWALWRIAVALDRGMSR